MMVDGWYQWKNTRYKICFCVVKYVFDVSHLSNSPNIGTSRLWVGRVWWWKRLKTLTDEPGAAKQAAEAIYPGMKKQAVPAIFHNGLYTGVLLSNPIFRYCFDKVAKSGLPAGTMVETAVCWGFCFEQQGFSRCVCGDASRSMPLTDQATKKYTILLMITLTLWRSFWNAHRAAITPMQYLLVGGDVYLPAFWTYRFCKRNNNSQWLDINETFDVLAQCCCLPSRWCPLDDVRLLNSIPTRYWGNW